MRKSKYGALQRPKIISIIAAGALRKKHIPDILATDWIIGVDRGALWLLDRGVVPDMGIGDFDSVTDREKKRIHDAVGIYIEHPKEKDATDLDLALEEAVSRRPERIRIYGALGKRFDHALAAVHVLSRLVSHNIKGEIVDNFNKIYIVRRQEKISRDSSCPYISVIPFGSDVIVTLKGFRYDVLKKKLILGSSLGISNEIFGEFATITVHKGPVIVVRSKD